MLHAEPSCTNFAGASLPVPVPTVG